MLVDNKPKAYLYKDIPYTKRLIGTKNGFIIKNYISGREKLSFEYRVHLNFNISFFSLVTTLARKKSLQNSVFFIILFMNTSADFTGLIYAEF